MYAEGTIDDTIRLSCSTGGSGGGSGTAIFDVISDSGIGIDYEAIAGKLTAGVDYEPTNPYGGKYFKIPAGTLDGTAWGIGEVVEFNTVSATRCFWIRQRVPADTPPHAENKFYLGASGDTV
jgi:hypothetical protein